MFIFQLHILNLLAKKVNDDDELLNTDEDPIDFFIYLVSNCEKDTFKKLRLNKIYSTYDEFYFI